MLGLTARKNGPANSNNTDLLQSKAGCLQTSERAVPNQKPNAYNSKARPPNTNHKQACSGKGRATATRAHFMFRRRRARGSVGRCSWRTGTGNKT